MRRSLLHGSTVSRAFGGSRLQLLLVHGLEVDLGQMHGRKAGALDDVGHVATQVGVDDLRAGHTHHAVHLVFGQIADLENAGLLGLDQEHGALADLGGGGCRHGHD